MGDECFQSSFPKGNRLAPMPSPAPPPAQSSQHPHRVIAECVALQRAPTDLPTLTPYHVPHRPNLSVIPSDRRPSAVRPKCSRACRPPPPHRLRPTLSLLHGGHDAGPREGLVETAQDLLPHSGAQLVRDFHHLHDPAQQRSAGTSWGCGGRAGRATRRKEGRSRKETLPASAPGQKVGRTSLDVFLRLLGAEQAQKSNMHSSYAGRSRGADPCPVPGPVPYSMKGKLFPLGLHPPALVLIHPPSASDMLPGH